MHTIDTLSKARVQRHRPSQQQPLLARERHIGHLINALPSLDDGTLSQIGIERSEIARLACQERTTSEHCHLRTRSWR